MVVVTIQHCAVSEEQYCNTGARPFSANVVMPFTPPLYIFDLDGTLAEADGRRLLLGEKPDAAAWEAFDAAGAHEQPIHAVTKTLHLLRAAGSEFLVLTGRSAAHREATVRWLVDHAGFSPAELEQCLLMRPVGDKTPITRLKRQWLEGMAPTERTRLVGIFEDHAGVVEMWRALGLICFQVAPGDF